VVRTLWSQAVSSSLRGLSAAHERGWFLVWDNHNALFLFNHAGQRQAQANPPGDLVAACASADGRTYAAVGGQGQVWLLAPDLTPRWQRSIDQRATAVALDSFGQRVAVAGADGALHLFDEAGSALWKSSVPRPLHHLAFVPERPNVVGAADFGLAACFDAHGRCVWRDGLVAHIGSLSTTGDGSVIALACFSEGVCCYSLVDGPKTRLTAPSFGSCRLLASSYDGKLWLTVGLDQRIVLRQPDGLVRAEMAVASQPTAVTLDPLGTRGAAALADGTLLAFDDLSSRAS
jgi:hypothetical protein